MMKFSKLMAVALCGLATVGLVSAQSVSKDPIAV